MVAKRTLIPVYGPDLADHVDQSRTTHHSDPPSNDGVARAPIQETALPGKAAAPPIGVKSQEARSEGASSVNGRNVMAHVPRESECVAPPGAIPRHKTRDLEDVAPGCGGAPTARTRRFEPGFASEPNMCFRIIGAGFPFGQTNPRGVRCRAFGAIHFAIFLITLMILSQIKILNCSGRNGYAQRYDL